MELNPKWSKSVIHKQPKKYLSESAIGYWTHKGRHTATIYKCEVEFEDGTNQICYHILSSEGQDIGLYTEQPDFDIPASAINPKSLVDQ